MGRHGINVMSLTGHALAKSICTHWHTSLPSHVDCCTLAIPFLRGTFQKGLLEQLSEGWLSGHSVNKVTGLQEMGWF